jgi:amino acid adenylation domain-containing protein/non-ribosomal peptide synthase protein (TIGR01720 family)
LSALNKKSLHAVIDHLLEQGGERVAIEEGALTIDYIALEQRSRELAWALKDCGVGPGVVVALPLPASIDYVVALVATVRAGGIFLPLDPAYPPARLARIFHLAPPRVLLTRAADQALAGRLAECADAPIDILLLDALPPRAAAEAPPVVAGDDDTGYLIHTSGSTGMPKLIAGRNKGLSHFAHWECTELGLDATVRASFFAPPTFDVSLREILVPLLAGGTLVVPEADVRSDATRLVAWLRERHVTLMHAVPSLFRLLTRALRDGAEGGLPELRHACLAGEPLYGADVSAWRAVAGNSSALINLYGPSETTLAKAFHRVDRETYAPGAIVPIGQPIANAALLILRQERLAEIGEIGEIHIRTPFASNGYWGDAARTAESFVPNPLAPNSDDRIYRTGDLGRYRPDRSVEFVGRADRQVKVDGVRIELPEIEGALRTLDGIDEAAAHVFRLADGSARLVGYYTSRTPIAAETVRAHLATLLPGAMIPGHLMPLPTLPKNLNGKIDRKALPRPEALLSADHAYSAAQGPIETALAALWAEALSVDRIGVESPWLTVGGNSLRAIGLIGRINREFGVALTIRDFLEHGTIRAQARVIATRQADTTPALTRAPDAPDYPLSDAQRRLWILSRLDDGQTLYNNVEWLELRGPLDSAALLQAFQILTDRHESLRTVFSVDADGEPRQRILPGATVGLPLVELPTGAAQAALDAALSRERGTAFDLEHGPLLRLTLLRQANDHHHLLVTLHHIVCDGWSMGLLTSELGAAYRAALAHQPYAPPLPEFRPRDVAQWLVQLEDTPLFTRCRDYWRTRLADADERAVLPADPAPPTGDRMLAGQVAVSLTPGVEAALADLLAQRQATPFMAVSAALAVLLYRYGGRENVVIGTPVAGRERPGLESVVGFCVNTLPLVLRLSPELSFAALLEQAGRALTELHAHQDLPFDRLLADYGDARNPLSNPLFEVMLAAEPAARELGLPGLQVTEHEPPHPAARYDLTLRFAEDGGHWRLLLEYRSTLWHPATMQRCARHLGNLIANLVAQPDQPLSAIDMLDPAEREQLEIWAHGPARPLPELDLGSWFARQAASTPQATALVSEAVADVGTSEIDDVKSVSAPCSSPFKGEVRGGMGHADNSKTHPHPSPVVSASLRRSGSAEQCSAKHRLRPLEGEGATVPRSSLHRQIHCRTNTLNYAQLDQRANAWAQALRESAGVRGGDVVALLLPRGSDWVAALLGILKAGAVVLPLDPRHPPARLREVLSDAGARALLAPPEALPDWNACPRLAPTEVTETGPVPTPETPPALESAAYLIYTSGSTGTPKGVLVSHLAFANMIADQIDALGVGPGDRVLQFVSPAFDVALFEVFLALLSGAALAIPQRNEVEDASGYAAAVARLGVSVIMLTPGFLHTLPDTALHGLRLVITGGEPPIGADVHRCRAAGLRYVNAYGPSETAVNAALHEVDAHTPPEAVPLGRASANCALRVVAPDLTPLPTGIAGELLISGVGVALGYLHRPALDARAFGTDPAGVRHYRSGDRVRRDGNGALYFVGRVDNQVKVRGHRIETGEVEAALKALPGVAAARVIARTTGADRELVGYWIADADTSTDATAIAAAIATRLPAYAVPAHFVRLERFPLTGNGKLDLARLPDPRSEHSDIASTPARTPDEATLVALWREVLALPEGMALGRDSDFFLLGGRSLAANRLALRVARALQQPVRLRDLYAAPTPAGLLARLAGQTLDALPALPEQQPAPLSPMQRRLWIISRLGESGGVYHISGLTRLEGDLDVAALHLAFTDLCTRQSVLRSRMLADPATDAPCQITDPPATPPLRLHGVDETVDCAALAAQPFDLASEWPLRLHLWQRSSHTWELLVVLHHLAGDGWSMPILVRELAEAYNARRAGHAPDWAPLPAQYRDVAAWLTQQLATGAHRDDADYWRTELAGELPLLDLPTDRPRPPVRRYHGATHELALPAHSLAALQTLATQHHSTPFATFLALVQTLLTRLSGQDQVIVGVPVAGRTHPASEGLVGFFVNTLPLRARLGGTTPFSAHLNASTRQLELAQQHQGYPFDRLVEDLDLPRDTARSPVFDVLISLDEGGDEAPALAGVTATALPLTRHGARCDLWWMLDLTSGAPTLRVEYDSDLFDPATIADWSARLLQLLVAAHAAPATPLAELAWMTPLERAALIAAASPDATPLSTDTVLDRYEAVVAASPEAIALIEDHRHWRYAELDHAANALARRIANSLGPSPDTAAIGVPIVALMLERGAAIPIALLACLKAGCAYLPIEPDSPRERIDMLLGDSGARLLLRSPGVAPPAADLTHLEVDVAELASAATSPAAPHRTGHVGPENAIYVMYTSGSTGRPKGVVIPHRAVTRLVIGSDYYRPEADDRLLQLSNYAFDGATFDYYAALAHGLTLCLPDRETVLDTASLAAFIRRHRVNVTFITTALLNRLVDGDTALLGQFRRIYFGGQEASLPHVRRALATAGEGALVHVYGPTEVTTFSTWHVVTAADLGESARRVPIGRPIAHTRAHIVDARGQLQPPGVPGELWLGGAGVARGYLGQPGLSGERFTASPLVAGDRVYRSGDLCLQRRDGSIEFLGRIDGQVKIRGYRVELGEIEGHLNNAPGVGKAHLLARPSAGGNLELVAYLTALDPARPPTLGALHAHLSRRLPAYMLPAHFVLLAQLPVNANGKVDRHALPPPQPGEPGLANGHGADDAPHGPAQTALAEAWRTVLRQPLPGIHDNYFALGGDSIQALQIVSRLREAGWALKITDLLRSPTIAALAALITPLDASAGATPSTAEDDPAPPLSPIQHWFLAQDFAQPAHFNQSVLLVLPRTLEHERLGQAIAALWRHHPGLRLTFGRSADGPWQRQLPATTEPCAPTVECRDAAALLADAQARQRGFDTTRGPLFSAVRYRLPDDDRLLLIAHHWVIDGVSWRTLLDDLATALAGRPLPPAGASLGAWTRGLAALAIEPEQRAWWHEQATAPVAALPRVNGHQPKAALARRQSWAFELPAAATEALSATGHTAYHTQGDELLLAAWVLALNRAAGGRIDTKLPPAFRVTLESHGRSALLDGVDISRTVGWFTAMFPLRFAPSGTALPTLIREVKETLRAIPDRGVGYGVLRWLARDEALAAAPPSEIGFNYLGRFDHDAALPVAAEAIGDELAPDTVLPHGIDVTAEIREHRLCVRLVCDTGRHPSPWCAQLALDYAAALEEIAAHCLDPAAGALSPSDVDLDGIALDDLDAILDGLGET